MKLKAKILGGYGIVLALLVLVSAWAVANLHSLGGANEAVFRENYRSIQAAENMLAAIEQRDNAILLAMLAYEDEAAVAVRENESEFLQWLGRAKDNVTLPGETEVLEAIESDYLAYGAAHDRMVELQATDADAAVAYYHDAVAPLLRSIREGCLRLRDMNQEAMIGASNHARVVASRAVWSTALLGATAAAIGLAFSLVLTNGITRPLQAMTQAAGRIAEGDYDVTIPSRSRDELGELAEEITTMSRRLKRFHELNVGRLIAEKRHMEAIIRSITDGIIVVDDQFQVIAANPKAAQVFGMSAGDAVGRHFTEVVRNRALYEYVRQTTRTGEAPRLDEQTSTLSVEVGGELHYYNPIVTPVKAEKGKMLGVVLLLQDVTSLKELDRLRNEFVMIASHELRTPLTSIAMSIELLMEMAHERSDREQELLRAAHEEVQRLRSLVSDLLDLSKIESGHMDMEFESVVMAELADRAVAMLTDQAAAAGVELSSRIAADLPEVRADPDKITWVLINLMANAIRYVDPGGYVRLAARAAGHLVYVAVSDNGVGIPYEYQSKIFDKFVQVKDDPRPGATGLGLAISKEIVRAHGGSIWVESVPGQGSTFTFTLPMAADIQPKEVEEDARVIESTSPHS